MRFRAPGRAAPAPVLASTLLVTIILGCTGLPRATQVPGPVQGEGEVATEDRTAGEFQHLSASGGIRVEITQGPATSVRLSAQPNLLPLITTRTSDGQLVVNVAAPGITSSQPVTLVVVVADLHSLTLSGGASGTLETTTETLTIDVSGGAVLEATGSASALALTVSSGAQAQLGALVADTATVTASDGGLAELTVVDSLSGDVTAGATVRLTQRPATVDVTTSVGGTVIGG